MKLPMARIKLATLLAVVCLFLTSTLTAYASSHRERLDLHGVCQADEDLFVFSIRAKRAGTVEISWDRDFSYVFDTLDVARGSTRFYTGEPFYSSQPDATATLFARSVDHPGVRTEATLSVRPCKRAGH